MSPKYLTVKGKLENLGYSNYLPIDAVPLVDSLITDLISTTENLQHYIDLAEKAMHQRSLLSLEVEPYKSENIKLVKENNALHVENTQLREELCKVMKESQRNYNYYSHDTKKLEIQLKKYKLQCRQLELRGICADTQSSLSKSKVMTHKKTINSEKIELEDTVDNLNNKIDCLERMNVTLKDEIDLLETKLENRNQEVKRLQSTIESGNKNYSFNNNTKNVVKMAEEINKVSEENIVLKEQLALTLEKQHEAMAKAVEMADNNTKLKEELGKVDTLAIKVEEECNNRLVCKEKEIQELLKNIDELRNQNIDLQVKLRGKLWEDHSNSCKNFSRENEKLQFEIKSLKALNQGLEEKLSKLMQDFTSRKEKHVVDPEDDLQYLLEKERKRYESYIESIEDKLQCTLENLNKVMNDKNNQCQKNNDSEFIKNLHKKIISCENKIVELRSDNANIQQHCKNEIEIAKVNDLQTKIHQLDQKVQQLNFENAELLKENLSLTAMIKDVERKENYREIESGKIRKLNTDLSSLLKEKNQIFLENKELLLENQTLKQDLNKHHKHYEHLYDENCSYKMTSRSEKASANYLMDECKMLRDKVKMLNEELMREKSISSHAKMYTMETERSTNEMHNQLMELQKQINMSKSKNFELEKRLKELQIENANINKEKQNIIDNLKCVDRERDQLVIQIDHKTEHISVMEQNLKTKELEIEKLRSKLCGVENKLAKYNLFEENVRESEKTISILENQVKLIKRERDNAFSENIKLQNELADASARHCKVELELVHSQKEVAGLKAQLQHYVAEVKHIEDLLMQKEKQREEMLQHFSSLSVEANLLESNNQSLENEGTTKSVQIRNYLDTIRGLENKINDQSNVIDRQSAEIGSLKAKNSAMQEEIKLLKDEKCSLESNVANLKKLIHTYEQRNKNISMNIERTDSELQTWEEKTMKLSHLKERFEMETESLKNTNASLENLLKNTRREVIELKLALQDATTETQCLKDEMAVLKQTSKSKEGGRSQATILSDPDSQDDDFDRTYISSKIKKRISAFTVDKL